MSEVVSEVVDAESNLRVSSEVGSSLLDDAMDSESKPFYMLPFPVKRKTNPIELTVENAGKWIGVLVNKDFDNKGCMGEVVNYCGETKLFKIIYDNDVSEEVDYQNLKQILAPPPLVNQYLKAKYPRWYSEKEKAWKRRHQPEGMRVPIHPRRHSSATLPPLVEPKKRKCKRETGTSAAASRPAYIPLAFRETKRDAYIYYK